MKQTFFTFLLAFWAISAFGQTQNQFFDGADTLVSSSITIYRDSASATVWQIGRPGKTLFDSAATFPNVIMTDTTRPYPINDSSSFYVYMEPLIYYGVAAIRWKQKLDLDYKQDGGIVEYSIDSGRNWVNAFTSPYVYNFYGFLPANVDTLPDSSVAFTGTDSSWRDIWLCFDYTYLYTLSSALTVRFRLMSDSVDSSKDGWMIDNLVFHRTLIHSAAKTPKADGYMQVYPTPTTGIVYLEAEKLQQAHIIEHMELINMAGQVVQRFGICPTKFFIDIGSHPNGQYYLKVTTNIKTVTVPVVLEK